MCLKHALRKCQLVKDYTVINRARNKNRYHFSHLKGLFSSIMEEGRDEFLTHAWLPESILDVQVWENQTSWWTEHILQEAGPAKPKKLAGCRASKEVDFWWQKKCLIVFLPLTMKWRTKWREKNPCLHTSLLIANEVGERPKIYFK